MNFRIGIDIGGTFTDLVLMDKAGNFTIYKEDSTPKEPMRAISNGLAGLAKLAGMSVTDMLKSTEVLVHGQTKATNALIERNGPDIAILATEGFRDITYFGYSGKPERYNIHLVKPEDFVPRYLRFGVKERVGRGGQVVTPLDEQSVVDAATALKPFNVKAVAIAFLWSFLNPSHERRAAEIIKRELPDVEVFCSSDILPEMGEWERTSATMLSAYVSPIIGDYLREFERAMKEEELPNRPLIMQVNGGCSPVPALLARPVNAIASGPAAAPAAGAYYASRTKRPENLIVVDMGGTSFDVCLLRDGEPVMSRDIRVADQPIGVNGVEVLSVGAGGGSIAWIDNGGSLRVGPRSAGSEPGPACYGQGGTEPTVTDANLVTGRMSSNAFLGGRRRLDIDLSKKAIDSRVATKLGLTTMDAAAGILTIVNNNMVSAIQSVSVQRGIDPREYVMVAGGGAGGLHGADCARLLEMDQVLVPRSSGGLCAFGMSVTPVRHDYVKVHHCITDREGIAAPIQALFDGMIEEARQEFERDGFASSEVRYVRYLEGRYIGQVHNLTVAIPEGPIDNERIAELEKVFHDEHQRRFTYSMTDQPIESVHWRLVATAGRGLNADTKASSSGGAKAKSAKPKETRHVFFPATSSFENTEIWEWDNLEGGHELAGPAIIESATTTIVINRDDHAVIQRDGSVLITIGK